MKNKNIWYIIGGVVIVVLLIVIIVIQVQNKQKQDEIQRELQRQQEEKEFCDSLEIRIKPDDLSKIAVDYIICSNADTSAKSVITLKNGQKIEEDVNLHGCVYNLIQYVASYDGYGYGEIINCEDIKSIELISKRCPQVKEIITEMSEIDCEI